MTWESVFPSVAFRNKGDLACGQYGNDVYRKAGGLQVLAEARLSLSLCRKRKEA